MNRARIADLIRAELDRVITARMDEQPAEAEVVVP